MNGKTLLFYSLVALWAVSGSSCQHEPSMSDFYGDYMVYTDHDQEVDFAAFTTYFLPDEILLIGNAHKAEYWKDDRSARIIGAVVNSLDAAGYQRTTDKAAASFGLQLSYVERVTYYVGYDYPYWWWYYPYYWTPGYWGNWDGWHYPYYVQYGYTAGSLLMEMVDLGADSAQDAPLPIVWDSYIGGLLSSSERINLDRAVTAVEQAFIQSPYLNRTATGRSTAQRAEGSEF